MMSFTVTRSVPKVLAPKACCCFFVTRTWHQRSIGSTQSSIHHQRRLSSSKPPIPPSNGSSTNSRNHGSSPITTATEASKANQQASRRRSISKASKLKTKETRKSREPAASDAPYFLPSVPSTQHLRPEDIYMASFFSLHRPMSVTTTVPTPSTSTSFSTIFASRGTAAPWPADIIYTLSTTVQRLEQASQDNEQSPHLRSRRRQQSPLDSQGSDALRAALAEVRSADQSSDTASLRLEDVAQHYRPFCPPPPPASNSRLETWRTGKLSTPENVLDDHTELNLHHGVPVLLPRDVPYDMESSFFHQHPVQRQPFLERMRERQERWNDSREEARRTLWRLISVKRQRKLKMKKHKYKKLMRRTRTLRRKLDKL